jgi:hypothetical protein
VGTRHAETFKAASTCSVTIFSTPEQIPIFYQESNSPSVDRLMLVIGQLSVEISTMYEMSEEKIVTDLY